MSARSLQMLRPTIRAEGSEIWFSWNPRRKSDAVDEFLRQKKPKDATVVQANWRDNPWWTGTLEAERKYDLEGTRTFGKATTRRRSKAPICSPSSGSESASARLSCWH